MSQGADYSHPFRRFLGRAIGHDLLFKVLKLELAMLACSFVRLARYIVSTRTVRSVDVRRSLFLLGKSFWPPQLGYERDLSTCPDFILYHEFRTAGELSFIVSVPYD